jgi:hypothetical protein
LEQDSITLGLASLFVPAELSLACGRPRLNLFIGLATPRKRGRGWLRPFVCLTKEIVMELDLVDEMNWEDSDKVEIISLEEAGLEEAPLAEETHRHGHVFRNGIHAYLDWFFDGSIENDDY